MKIQSQARLILFANSPNKELMRFIRPNLKSLRGRDGIRQQYPASQRHTLNHTTHSWPPYQLASASRQRMSFANPSWSPLSPSSVGIVYNFNSSIEHELLGARAFQRGRMENVL